MAKWIECPYCTHKLFKVTDDATFKIEIKCPSCKRIFDLGIKNGDGYSDGEKGKET